MSSTVWADGTTTDNKKRADELFLEGRELLGKKDAAGACKKFLEAQKLETNNVAILLNLGACNDQQGHNASALRWYRRTVNAASEKKDPASQEYVDAATERTTALSSQVSTITFNIDKLQPDALIFLDNDTIAKNELVVEVDKGPHSIEARLPGMKTSRVSIDVDGNDKRLTHTFQPLEDAPLVGNRRRRRLMGGLIGGSVILVVSAGTGLWAHHIQGKYDAAVKENNDETEDKKAKQEDNMKVATLTWVGGLAVGVGIAAYFFFTAPPGERQEEAPRTVFTPTASKDGLGFAMFRRF